MAGEETRGLAGLRQRHKLALQAVALAVIVGGSLVLYVALTAGAGTLAAACFALIAAAFLLTMWVS